MALDIIQAVIAREIGLEAWAFDNELRGEKVAKFRRYVDGDHDAQMTPEMRKLLRIDSSTNISMVTKWHTKMPTGAPFNANKCDDVIQTMADRLTVDSIEGDNAAATKWAGDVLEFNRFDGLQMDVHEATLRDADSYIALDWDADEGQVVHNHELAWDGIEGMLVVYKSNTRSELACAIKTWNETNQNHADTQRVNIYYPDRIEKFVGVNGQTLQRYEDPDKPGVWPIPWTMDGTADGEPIGVPIIPFKNRARGKGDYGLSELENVLPLQDAMNRTLHSMVMTAELSAFPIMVAKGFSPPAGITPGAIIKILAENGGPLTKDQIADFSKIEGSNLDQFIHVAQFFEEQIENISRTPNMRANANLSGEAMKQSEIKLIGKVKRFQVKAGTAWEDVMAMTARVQTAFGTQAPPASKRWHTKWAQAEIRNDSQSVADALAILKQLGPGFNDEFIKLIAPVEKWDDEKIIQISQALKDNQQQRVQNALNSFNPFPSNAPNGIKPQQPTQNMPGMNAMPMMKPVTAPVAAPG